MSTTLQLTDVPVINFSITLSAAVGSVTFDLRDLGVIAKPTSIDDDGLNWGFPHGSSFVLTDWTVVITSDDSNGRHLGDVLYTTPVAIAAGTYTAAVRLYNAGSISAN